MNTDYETRYFYENFQVEKLGKISSLNRSSSHKKLLYNDQTDERPFLYQSL